MPVELSLPAKKQVRVLTAGGAASMSLPHHHTTTTSNGHIGHTYLNSNGEVITQSQSQSKGNDNTSTSSGSSSPAKVENKPSNDSDPRRSISISPNSYDRHYDDDEANISYDDDDHDPNQEIHSLLDHQDKEAQRHLDDLYGNPNDNDQEHENDPDGDGDGHHNQENDESLTSNGKVVWLFICFFGIMLSFVGYGLLLEYATSGGRKLHELSFLFVTSLLYTCTAAAGRNVRGEEVTTIPPARFAVLGITSMGSTFCSVRSLRYVIFPIQVLAKSCKPVPVMIMGAFMGKQYPLRKYMNVCLIVAGVGLFMGGGDASSKKSNSDESELSSSSQIIGIVLLFISLCFDGGTGAYEDKLMSVHSVGPFDLMYNIQLGKTIIAGVSLLVLNQVHVFLQMCQDMGLVLVALGLTGAIGQVFIFITISKFGALTCSIIGLSRKVTTLVASIYFYGHHLNGVQITGLVVCVSAMVMNFMGKKGKGGGHGHGAPKSSKKSIAEIRYRDNVSGRESGDKLGDFELPPAPTIKPITAGGS